MNLLPKVLILSYVVSLAACQKSGGGGQQASPEVTDSMSIKRGEYLVTIIGCDHCHTPKKMTDQGPIPDHDRWLIGHPEARTLPKIDNQRGSGNWLLLDPDLTAVVGPLASILCRQSNSRSHGLANWTYDQFKRAMTEGKHRGLENGRGLLPPMPWQSYRSLKEEDLRTIFESYNRYPRLKKRVPAHIPPSNLPG